MDDIGPVKSLHSVRCCLTGNRQRWLQNIHWPIMSSTQRMSLHLFLRWKRQQPCAHSARALIASFMHLAARTEW